MNTEISSTNDEDLELLYHIQKILACWIYSQGFASWNRINRTCRNIILSLPIEKQKYFNTDYPIFKVFIPMLRTGSAEVCKNNERVPLLYFMNHDTSYSIEETVSITRKYPFISIYSKQLIKENDNHLRKTFSPIDFLQQYPPIEQQIKSFSIQEISKSQFRDICDINTYQFKTIANEEIETGIYKTKDLVWYPSYLFSQENTIYRIPYYDENPDALNLARLYVRLTNSFYQTKPLFEYDVNLKELKCLRYSELPILLTRALLLVFPNQFTDKEFCKPNPQKPFQNISMTEIVELERIFSKQSVQIKKR